jgi:arginine decarboxylase
MNILVTHGTGSGPTEISAFDRALVDAGVANYNLLYLSSVLPPASNVIEEKPKPYAYGEWGDRLYVVMAQMRVSKANDEAWAGIGWMQDMDDDGRGHRKQPHRAV